MKQIHVDIPPLASSSYSIWINSKLLETPSTWMPKHEGHIVIITDNVVKKYYGTAFEKNLNKAGYKTLLLSFRAGEKSKCINTKCKLEEKMLHHHCGRQDTLILALGGGVVGDLAGFTAATYMRGIPYIQIPTTLLAMLDSSVGGKTGIDTPQGKNLIGAFWQPQAVISDIHCLKTLSKKHTINGLIEALKVFLISGVEHIPFLQEKLDDILNYKEDVLIDLVERAVKIKADIVKKDERETNQRAILNFGHTIGHALEQITRYKLLHGYAVAYGLLIEAKIAQLLGVLDSKHYQYIKTLLKRLNIETEHLKQFNIEDIISSTKLDKKNHTGNVNYVLLSGLGKVYSKQNHFTHPVPDKIVHQAFLETISN